MRSFKRGEKVTVMSYNVKTKQIQPQGCTGFTRPMVFNATSLDYIKIDRCREKKKSYNSFGITH